MERTHRAKRTRTAVSLAAAAMVALGAFAGPAMAAGATEIVSGTTQGLIALTGTAAAFTTGFTSGSTATATGLLTATNTTATSSLSVNDAGAATGHMIAATGATCAAGDQILTNALNVTVTGTGFASAGQTAIVAGVVVVGTAAAPIAAKPLTTTYLQVLPDVQRMLTGCVYTMTATYTLQ
jgi:hypothetical protein